MFYKPALRAMDEKISTVRAKIFGDGGPGANEKYQTFIKEARQLAKSVVVVSGNLPAFLLLLN